MTQILGVLLLALAGWLLWSPWALAIAGVVLLAAPEFVEFRRNQRAAAEELRRRGVAR